VTYRLIALQLVSLISRRCCIPTFQDPRLDTHVLIWWLADASKLSRTAKRAIQTAAGQG